MAEETKKKKLPSTFANMVIVLTVIALISAMALAFTYKMTEAPRLEVKRLKTLNALKQVLPDFDSDPDQLKFEYLEEGEKDPKFKMTIYPAKKGGELVGTAIKSYSKNAFGDPIWVMVGFDKDQKVIAVSVLEQKETPGLGTKITEDSFKNKFKGIDPSTEVKVTKDGGKVDAISAATITSRAFCETINRAYKALQNAKPPVKKEGAEGGNQ